MAASTFLN